MSQTSISLKLGEDAAKAIVDTNDKTKIGDAAIRVVIKRTMNKAQAVDLLERAKQRLSESDWSGGS